MLGALKPWHIIVFVIVLVLLFGAKRLPDAARSLGRSLRIIKAETKGLIDDNNDVAEKAEPQTSRQPLNGEVYGQPGYQQQPPAGYQPPQPGYQPPPAGYQPPPAGYQPPQPGYQPPPAQPYIDPVQRTNDR
ncbi:MAG: sec-independent protein translocase protein TatA [Actinoplanes sp.]|jgi:sec-independent protein translocase protein TatA|nr:sec-independent protein translocase protein TatA [Actinoplanes sp.]